MLLTPFLSTQPKISKGQKNCIKALYNGMVLVTLLILLTWHSASTLT
jgi:hypothetical protein